MTDKLSGKLTDNCEKNRLAVSLTAPCFVDGFRSRLCDSLCLSLLMVVLNRISFLRRLAELGAQCVFTVSVNSATGVQKVKVNINPSVRIPCAQQFCTLQMIEFLFSLCLTHVVSDKGHKHSNGKSEMVFYITGTVSDIGSMEHSVQPDPDDPPCLGHMVHAADQPCQPAFANATDAGNKCICHRRF